MQLHTLTFEAIGPFPGRHTIDFSQLGASGVFLLEGPTGAGKSTIIDAIVFALYGGLAGEDASKQRLHSHHAAADVEPFVELVFTVGAGSFRIRRTPAHERPKKTGTGTTTQNEKATLVALPSLDAPEVAREISSRTQEIGAEISRLIGLNRAQFLQTVVLPQGEFAKFLRATGEDRKELLKTIFRTDVYEELTAALVAMRRETAQTIAASKALTGNAFEGFRTATQHEFADGDLSLDDIDAAEALAVSVCEQLATRAMTASTDEAAALRAFRAAADHEAAERQLSTTLTRRAELLARRARLDNATDTIKALRDRRDMSRRASVVAPLISGLRTAEGAAGVARDRLVEAHRLHGTVAGAVDKADLERELAELSTQLTQLADLLPIEARLPARRSGLDERRSSLADLEGQIAVLGERIAQAPAAIQRQQAVCDELTARAQGLEGAESAVRTAAEIVAAARDVHSITTEISALATVRDQRMHLLTEATSEVASLHRRRLDGYAGELSGQLAPGRPCPVCGSAEHPRPAVLDHDHPTPEDISRAEENRATCDAAVTAAIEALNERQQHRARRHAQAGGKTVAEAEVDHRAASEALTAATAAHAESAAARTGLESLRDQQQADQAALGEAKVAAAALDAGIEAGRAELEADEVRLSTALAERSRTISELVETLTARRSVVSGVASAREAHTSASLAVDSRRHEVDEALMTQNFSTIEEAQGARLSATDLADIEARIKAHDDEVTLVTDGLRQKDIVGLTGDETPDVEAAAAEATRCEEISARAHQAAVLATERSTVSARSLASLRTAIGRYREAVGASAAIERMAGIADGSHPANQNHVTLGTYVLMRRFEDVVQAANVRYGPMSDGRYQLRRIDDKEGKGGGRRTGLALAVLDGETGREREPRTLSGGETFNASLCLALGLADVVTGESGGIELGTLFVDEGFGTLDAESLDRVMIELGKLSRGGRMVGIVSHVEELKQRIADQISVHRSADGSSTINNAAARD